MYRLSQIDFRFTLRTKSRFRRSWFTGIPWWKLVQSWFKTGHIPTRVLVQVVHWHYNTCTCIEVSKLCRMSVHHLLAVETFTTPPEIAHPGQILKLIWETCPKRCHSDIAANGHSSPAESRSSARYMWQLEMHLRAFPEPPSPCISIYFCAHTGISFPMRFPKEKKASDLIGISKKSAFPKNS